MRWWLLSVSWTEGWSRRARSPWRAKASFSLLQQPTQLLQMWFCAWVSSKGTVAAPFSECCSLIRGFCWYLCENDLRKCRCRHWDSAMQAFSVIEKAWSHHSAAHGCCGGWMESWWLGTIPVKVLWVRDVMNFGGIAGLMRHGRMPIMHRFGSIYGMTLSLTSDSRASISSWTSFR